MLQQPGQPEYWTRKLSHNGKPWTGPDQYEETGSYTLAMAATPGNGNRSSKMNRSGTTSTSSGSSGSSSSSSSSSGSSSGGQLCRLPSDMVLLYDAEFKKWVELYAQDRNRFFHDFALAYAKLLELGVPFPPPQRPWWKRWFLFFL
jgi:hypothetical protein